MADPAAVAAGGQDKSALRRSARAARTTAHAAEGSADRADGWTRGVRALVESSGADVVALHTSYGVEPPTAPLVDALLSGALPSVRTVLLPVLRPDRDLDWVDASALPQPPDGPLRSADVDDALLLGLDAVASAGLLVVPALLVDRGGARLGQGGGSYDRALSRARPDALVVAIVDDDELLPEGALPVEPHDRAVTHVVTPSGVVVIGATPSR
jgi:5-formyltetrahydrofolate cyclo-ligase